MKVHIWPSFTGADQGDGGVRRIVEMQRAGLPELGVELVDNPADADALMCHITIPPQWLNQFPQKPIIACVHGFYWAEYEWENWALKANADVMELCRIADVITAPSEWVARSIRRHTMRPVRVVNHGVNLDDWYIGENKGYVLWNKTRPDPVCDPQPVNDVAALMPDMTFVTTFGHEASNVTLTGRLPFETARELIENAGVYLCTSRETFGVGTLEALASGVPVVGYRWGGQAEFIEHMVDGYLVRPGDVQDLANGIRWAFENRAAISVAAREKAEQFPWRFANEGYAEAISEAVRRGARRKAEPKVSIIVTAYKLDKYLDDCLRSVSEQGEIPSWECLIVDDASPDRCGEIADAWAAKDKRFKAIHNKTNQYLAAARNTAIENARGAYILPLDADDMIAPGTIESLAHVLDTDRQTHIAYGNVFFVDEDGRTPTDYEVRGKTPGHSGWPIPFDFQLQSRGGNCLPYCSMYRREVWELSGGYRRRMRTAEDADFWLRASSYGFRPKYAVEQDTLIYRNRQGSMSRVQAPAGWFKWFPWGKQLLTAPAGASTPEQLPIEACDPVVVSVVIPVGPDHLDLFMDAVDSVDAQAFRSWECIVVNDSGKKLPRVPSWVKVINTEGKTGVAHARNVGIKAAEGIFFLPLDADDYLMPDALAWMLEAYQESGDIIYTDFWEDPDEEGKLKVYRTPDWNPRLLTSRGCIHAVTALTPKTYWERIGGYDESLPAWEDWSFMLSLADLGLCSRRLAAPLFVYRKHTGTRSNENYAEFDESKQGILAKWADLWKPSSEGGRDLMACGACGSGTQSIYPVQATSPAMLFQQAERPEGDVMLIQYVGSQLSTSPWRGPSGTTYIFQAGDPAKYIFKQDAEWFLRWPDFREVGETPAESLTTTAPTEQVDEEPALIADGPPKARRR